MLAFMTIIYFMSVLGGHVTDNDPMLNPDFNRDIHVERKFGALHGKDRFD